VGQKEQPGGEEEEKEKKSHRGASFSLLREQKKILGKHWASFEIQIHTLARRWRPFAAQFRRLFASSSPLFAGQIDSTIKTALNGPNRGPSLCLSLSLCLLGRPSVFLLANTCRT